MDMLYEAKIMDVQPAEKPNEGYRYKVHYKGWKNTWDDWVLVDRIRPFDDEHKELAAQLHAQLKTSMQKTTKVPKKVIKSGGESARGSEERSSAVTQGGRGGRRGKDWDLEQVRIALPFSAWSSLCYLFRPSAEAFFFVFLLWKRVIFTFLVLSMGVCLSFLFGRVCQDAFSFCLTSRSSSLSGLCENGMALYNLGNALKRAYLAFSWPESGVFGFKTRGRVEVTVVQVDFDIALLLAT